MTPDSLRALIASVREVYRRYPQPWVIGFSGGKDSTAVLQLVWLALSDLAPEERTKPVFVLSSNTGVENPLIEGHIDDSLLRINSSAEEAGLPLRAITVFPETCDSFWVNLIGRGYPAPTTRFRWCTERLKISPVSRFVRERVAEFGEVIMVLGVRKQESATRAQLMNAHALSDHVLRRHASLTGAYVYAPVEDWSSDDVWTFLLQIPSPWGASNRDLAALYRSASGEECPLVIDMSTPSCGKSRFGCWVCTVASKDSSMASLVEDGHDWLEPLLDYRDFLFDTTDPEQKRRFRDIRGRDGRVQVKRDGTLAARSYTLETSKEMLRQLLLIQEEMRRTRPDLFLIRREELDEIRRIWVYERHDWQDSLPGVVNSVTVNEGAWPFFDDLQFDEHFLQALASSAEEHAIPAELLARLLEAERSAALRNRHGIHKQIEKIIQLDWRPEEEIVTAYCSFLEDQV